MPPQIDAPERPRMRTLTRLVGGLAFGTLLWLVGFEVGAIVVSAISIAVAGASLVVPSVASSLEGVLSRVARVVGEVLTAVLLTAAHVVIFWPTSLILRLVGHDPLGPGVRGDEQTFWYQRRGRSLPNRQYADERFLWAGSEAREQPRSRVDRVVYAVGVVVALLALDLGAGALYGGVHDLAHEQAAAAWVRGQTFDPTQQPALRDVPYAAQLLEEQVNLPSVRDPFLSYRLLDFDGVYTHIQNGARASYQPAADGRRPARILFFGGSALFGSGQRDEHTIPSEVARLAEADGVPVEVVNYGRPGYANWSEVELFEQIVTTGERGDVVVFYDGFNDLHIEMNIGPFTEPTTSFDATQTNPDAIPGFKPGTRVVATPVDTDTDWSDIAGAYWDNSGIHHVVDDVSSLFGGGDAPPEARFTTTEGEGGATERRAEGPAIETAARNAVHLVRRGVDIAEAVADGHNMQSFFFWQPFLHTKHVVPGEEQLERLVPYEPERWLPAVAEAHRRLPSNVTDLYDALDATDQPVMWDFVHTNELGARLVAEAMYAKLKPSLVESTRGDGGQAR